MAPFIREGRKQKIVRTTSLTGPWEPSSENHESDAVVARGDSRVFYGTLIPAVSMMVAYAARSCFSAAS